MPNVDAAYLNKRIQRLKENIRNLEALERSFKEAIQEARTPADKRSSEEELRRTVQMIQNLKYEIAEMEKALHSAGGH